MAVLLGVCNAKDCEVYSMKKDRVLFGVSPFNSKFSEGYLHNMLEWGFDNYRHVDILHAHEESRYLLMGCGNDENKARRYSRKEFNRAERVINKLLAKKGKSLSSGGILKFSDFYSNESYKYFMEKVRKDYVRNKEFYNLCREHSHKAIMHRKKSTNNDTVISDKEVDIAVEYILIELPFLIAPSVLLSTHNEIDVSYYCDWSVADYLYNGKLSLMPYSKTRLVIKDHAPG